MKRTSVKSIIAIATLIGFSTAWTSATAADAKATWEKDCAKCHGPDGKGDTKIGKTLQIKDFTDAKVQASFKDEDMSKAIKDGIKDGDKTRMKAAEGLSDAEIKALVTYVRALKK
jgi:cytochrome c553